MNKIYYLTRSYYPYQKGGGPIVRTGAVKYLKELGWDVVVIMPNYYTREYIILDDIWQIPFNKRHSQKIASVLERIGVYEDYLDRWVASAFLYLKDKIEKDDILFATSGGELGMIKLASILKEEVQCKFVVNFQDPLNYGYMNGLRRDKRFHIGREKFQKKYIQNSDLIVTSSKYYQNVIKGRFPKLSQRVYNNYFGFVEKVDLSRYKKQRSNKLRIAYAGIMSDTQKPELLYKAYKNLNVGDIELYFVGNIKNYKPLQNIEDDNVFFIDFLPHEEFLRFMSENIDVGFVSLTSEYYAACVPSKIYEYINLGLPMLGALPSGDGKNIINHFGFGLVCEPNDVEDLSENIKKIKKLENLKRFEENILNKKNSFFMGETIKELDLLLKGIT